MAFELKDNSGSVFKNKRKEKDTHPDFTGEAKVKGVVHWVSMWVKQDKNGNPYYSFSFKEKDFSKAKDMPAHPSTTKEEKRQDSFDDQIPF